MSRTLRWVLGILAVLVVLAVVAGGIWLVQHRSQMMSAYRQPATQPNAQGAPGAPNTTPGQNPPRGPQGFGDDRRFPMMRGWNDGSPMMGQRRFMHAGPFMPFGMGLFFMGGLFHLIVPLAVLVLVAFVFYQLGRRARTSSVPAPAPRRDANPSDTSDASKSD